MSSSTAPSQPRFAGELTAADAVAHGCRLVAAVHGADGSPEHVAFTLLVDGGGLVMDARFRATATSSAESWDALCELAIGRLLVDAAAITPRQVDAHLRQGGRQGLILGADADQAFYVLRKALEQFQPAPAAAPAGAAAGLPWEDCGLFEKVRRIEAVLDAHIRPALASDGGGIDLVDLKDDELWVQYQGACGSCSSSVGGTLQFVQDALANHLGRPLAVKVASLEEAPSITGGI